jgi:hypothetical protein
MEKKNPVAQKRPGFFMTQTKGGTNEIIIHHHAYPFCA